MVLGTIQILPSLCADIGLQITTRTSKYSENKITHKKLKLDEGSLNEFLKSLKNIFYYEKVN